MSRSDSLLAETDRPKCSICGEPAPWGDARIPWLMHHESWLHRTWHRLRRTRHGS